MDTLTGVKQRNKRLKMVKAGALLHKELIGGSKPLGIKFSVMGVVILAAAMGAVMVAYWLTKRSADFVKAHVPQKAGGAEDTGIMDSLIYG